MLIFTGQKYFPEWENMYYSISVANVTMAPSWEGRAMIVHTSEKLYARALVKYIVDVNGDAERIVRDATEIVAAFDLPDFEYDQWFLEQHYKSSRKNIPEPQRDFNACFEFLKDFLSFQYEASDDFEEPARTECRRAMYELIYNKVSMLFPPPETVHRPEEADNSDLEQSELTRIKRSIGVNIIRSVGARQMSITDRRYMYALTPYPNKVAYIAAVSEEFFSQLVFRDGMLDIPGSGITHLDLKQQTEMGMQDLKEIDLPLLREIFTAVYKSAKDATLSTTTVYLPAFSREMGIDISAGKPVDLFRKLSVFRNCFGVMGKSFWKVLDVLGYDEESNCIELATPYFNRLIIAQRQELAEQQRKSRRKAIAGGYTRLIHSTIVKERNKVAVEIVYRLITGLVQRGGLPDDKLARNRNRHFDDHELVTYSISFMTIIDNVPVLKRRLKDSTATNKNLQLSRSFKKAYELMHTQTDVYEYFIDLNIPEIIPTSTTLNEKLVITHRGINGSYRSPNMW